MIAGLGVPGAPSHGRGLRACRRAPHQQNVELALDMMVYHAPVSELWADNEFKEPDCPV